MTDPRSLEQSGKKRLFLKWNTMSSGYQRYQIESDQKIHGNHPRPQIARSYGCIVCALMEIWGLWWRSGSCPWKGCLCCAVKKAMDVYNVCHVIHNQVQFDWGLACLCHSRSMCCCVHPCITPMLCLHLVMYVSGWWFGTFFIFPYIGFLIIPID